MKGELVDHDVADLLKAGAPYNPRTIDPENLERLARSLQEFGQVENVVLNTRTGRIVSGHQRVEAATRAGVNSLTVLEVDLDEVQEKALNVALNNERLQGEWDEPALLELLQDLDADPTADLELSGFDVDFMEDLDAKLADLLDDSPGEISPPPPPPKLPVTKPGELFIIDGRHRVLCGDSTIKEDRARLLGDNTADMVFTDPPYAMFGSSTGFQGDVVDDKMVRSFFRDALDGVRQSLKPFGHAYICCDWRSYSTWWEMNRTVGLTPKNLIVWHKKNARLGAMYAASHELIFLLSNRPEKKRLTEDSAGERPVYGETNVWDYPMNTHDIRDHFAEKPLPLPLRAIKNSTDKGQVVLDLFTGSGTTLIAADQLGRVAYCMEMEPRFMDVILRRYKDYKPGAIIEKQ